MKLFNKGRREIQTKDGSIFPQKAVKVTKEDGEKLLALYGRELINVDAIGKDDAEQADIATAAKKASK